MWANIQAIIFRNIKMLDMNFQFWKSFNTNLAPYSFKPFITSNKCKAILSTFGVNV